MRELQPAYRGEAPHVFVCYAHDNSDTVFSELAELQSVGINIWYDEGISGGRVWRQEIHDALTSAQSVLFYVSSASLASQHCNREISVALDENMHIVPVYLEDVDLPGDLKIGLSRVQALYRSHDDYWRRLLLALGSSAPTEAMKAQRVGRAKWVKHLVGGVGLIVALTVAFVVQRVGQDSATPTREDKQSSPAVGPLTVAAPPFDVVGPDAAAHAFARAAVADLRSAFSETPVKVLAVSEVQFIVEGTVRRMPDSFRLTFELRRTTDEELIWAQILDAPIDASEFVNASSVANLVSLRLQDIESVRSAARKPNEPARQALLAAQRELAKGDINWRVYRQHMERVSQLDPDYVDPNSVNAAFEMSGGPGESANAARNEAHRLVARLLEGEPNRTFMLGHMNGTMDLDYAAAIRNLDHDQFIRGANGDAENAMSIAYLNMGRPDRALVHSNNALSLGSRRPWNDLLQLGHVHYSAGRFEAARDAYDRAATNHTPGFFQAVAMIGATESTFYMADLEDAERRLDEARELYGQRFPMYFSTALALSGQDDAARELLEAAERRFDEGIPARHDTFLPPWHSTNSAIATVPSSG